LFFKKDSSDVIINNQLQIMNKILQVLVSLIIIITSVVVGIIVLHFSETAKRAEDISTPDIKEEKVEHEGQNFVKQEEDKEKNTEESVETDWQWVNKQKRLYELSSTEINSILKDLQLRFPEKAERLKALAVLRIGTPYQLGRLGEESGRDKDPIFRLDVTDCTGFVLTNAALLHSQTIDEAKEMMKYLDYQPDSDPPANAWSVGDWRAGITFENRLHFTTDRNMTSPYFQDITERVAGPEKIKEKTVILNKIKSDGKRLIDIDWEKEIVLKYIPNEYITKELFQNLPKAIGIAFVKEGDEKIGLDVRHEGFLFDGQFLFHATPTEGKVVEVDFFEYYFGKEGNPRFDGLIFFEIK